MKKWNKKIVIFIFCLLVIVFIVCLRLGEVRKENIIAEHLESAQKYLNELDYEQAIVECEAILAIEPHNAQAAELLETVYLQYAQEYLDTRMYEEALEILERGKVNLSRASLEKMKDQVESEQEEFLRQEEQEPREPRILEKEIRESQKEAELTPEEICKLILRAGIFQWNWFWDNSSDHVDKLDTLYRDRGEGYGEWEYVHVNYEGIDTAADVLNLTMHFFTSQKALELFEQKDWIEQDGKLYVSEPDGIGGPEPDRYEIGIDQSDPARYVITVYEYWNDELWSDPYIIHLEQINGYWVFDEAPIIGNTSVTIRAVDSKEVFEMSETVLSDVEADFRVTGVWVNEGYDSEWNWAGSYRTTFGADKTVVQSGWRNEDHGIYEISEDGTFLTAYYTENYINNPGIGLELLEGYTYTVRYQIDPEQDTLYAAYSQEFQDARYSNADDGILTREP